MSHHAERRVKVRGLLERAYELAAADPGAPRPMAGQPGGPALPARFPRGAVGARHADQPAHHLVRSRPMLSRFFALIVRVFQRTPYLATLIRRVRNKRRTKPRPRPAARSRAAT